MRKLRIKNTDTMPLTTRNAAQGIPPKVRAPARSQKHSKTKTTQKRNATEKNKKHKQQLSTSDEEDSDENSDSSEPEMKRKRKRMRQNSESEIELIHDKPLVQNEEIVDSDMRRSNSPDNHNVSKSIKTVSIILTIT